MKKKENKPQKIGLTFGVSKKQIVLPNIYQDIIKVNYPLLIKKDLHIAEIYRVGSWYSPVTWEQLRLNPFQSHIDEETNDIWVDVLLERREEVSLDALSEIMQIHGKPGESRIISGRITADKLLQLEEKVVRMETARPISKTLDQSRSFIKADKAFLEKITPDKFHINGKDITGAGVVIGIIDDGCDFNHPNFKKEDGKKTRLLYLWDQRNRNDPPPSGKLLTPNYYGYEFDETDINTALSASVEAQDSDLAYIKLGYKPADDAHGTHVMDIAAGNSANPDYLGIAPEAELIFVHLGSPTTPEEIEYEERKNFGSSKYLVDAFNYILEKAGNNPVVINMSLATNGGAHNGKSLTDVLFDSQLTGQKRALVIAAGNAARGKIHAFKKIFPTKDCEFLWNMPGAEMPEETSWYARYEMEIWYPKSKEMKVEVYKPDETIPLLTCEYGEEQMNPDSNIQPLVLITNSASDNDKENHHVDILVDHQSNGFVKGTWRIKLVSVNDTTKGKATLHAWIERNDRYPSTFAANSTSVSTINGIGTGALPIVVGAHDDTNDHKPINYSGFGPSLNESSSEKPEVCAPGQNILSAQAGTGHTVFGTGVSGNEFTTKTASIADGTSMAAPHVTGVIALMFHAAQLAGLDYPTTEEIRTALKETATNNGKYDQQTGYGQVNALKAIKKIIQK